MRSLRLGLAQVNATVGDLHGNVRKIQAYIEQARSLEVDLLAFPELVVTGYPPEDLLLKPQFIEENLDCLKEIVASASGLTVVVGFVDMDSDIYNAAAVISESKLVGAYRKVHLPNYGVFDEARYFQAGRDCPIYSVKGTGIGINICEDIWYEGGPATAQAYGGAEVILNISSSPYHLGKGSFRERMLAVRAVDNVAFVAYVNAVGGQDELVFDGNSMVFDGQGVLLARGKQFEEDLIVLDLDIETVFRSRLHDPRRRREMLLLGVSNGQQPCIHTVAVPGGSSPASKSPLPGREGVPVLDLAAEVYAALVLGTGDYVHKNRFEKVVVGLSGGVDSSLVATIAVDALGAENVVGVAMPSRYSSRGSLEDARLLSKNLGMKFMVIPIDAVFQSYLDTMAEPFAGTKPGVAEENVQARARGNVLMALSNKFGWLVLTTGNKSEIATGYCTLYGDMAGGFAVIKDVPKTLVYKLARHRNSRAGYDLIPQRVLEKEPSAELRPNQRDVDSLPPYEVLDPVLTAYVEEDRSVEQIVAEGFDQETVQKAARLVDGSEYKRRQSPPGIKITPRAFGRDRRLPITNRFRG